MRLPELSAVVTGAVSGLGKATAQRLHEEGARVVLADLDAPQGQEAWRAVGAANFARCDVYAASKHAVTRLVKRLALELGPLGIRVNAVAPVAIDPPLLRAQLAAVSGDVDAAIDQVAAALQLLRIPTPRDFTDAVVFLASAEARCITGHTLLLDCGATAGFPPPNDAPPG